MPLLQRFLASFNSRAQTSAAAGRRVLPQEQLRAAIVHERMRTDRSGLPFCVLVFALREADDSLAAFGPLLDLLLRRLRTTDELGWLDADRLAAVLPYTREEGAWKLADDVLLQWGADQEPPWCEVYSYPGRGDDALDQDSESAKSERPVRGLEPLFVKALPRWKRGLDFLAASGGLLVTAPLWLVVAAGIKLTSPGPVFFRQWRSGAGGRPFRMFKFRTMRTDAEQLKSSLMALNEQDGPAFKIKHDPRVTRLGRFLRATSLDELPQLLNVLRGEMSLVGPRPLPCNESAACQPWQRRRLEVAPGLTCTWQVEGRSQVKFDDWMRMDIRYVNQRSILNDLLLLLRTIPAVLLRRGAS